LQRQWLLENGPIAYFQPRMKVATPWQKSKGQVLVLWHFRREFQWVDPAANTTRVVLGGVLHMHSDLWLALKQAGSGTFLNVAGDQKLWIALPLPNQD